MTDVQPGEPQHFTENLRRALANYLREQSGRSDDRRYHIYINMLRDASFDYDPENDAIFLRINRDFTQEDINGLFHYIGSTYLEDMYESLFDGLYLKIMNEIAEVQDAIASAKDAIESHRAVVDVFVRQNHTEPMRGASRAFHDLLTTVITRGNVNLSEADLEQIHDTMTDVYAAEMMHMSMMAEQIIINNTRRHFLLLSDEFAQALRTIAFAEDAGERSQAEGVLDEFNAGVQQLATHIVPLREFYRALQRAPGYDVDSPEYEALHPLWREVYQHTQPLKVFSYAYGPDKFAQTPFTGFLEDIPSLKALPAKIHKAIKEAAEVLDDTLELLESAGDLDFPQRQDILQEAKNRVATVLGNLEADALKLPRSVRNASYDDEQAKPLKKIWRHFENLVQELVYELYYSFNSWIEQGDMTEAASKVAGKCDRLQKALMQSQVSVPDETGQFLPPKFFSTLEEAVKEYIEQGIAFLAESYNALTESARALTGPEYEHPDHTSLLQQFTDRMNALPIALRNRVCAKLEYFAWVREHRMINDIPEAVIDGLPNPLRLLFDLGGALDQLDKSRTRFRNEFRIDPEQMQPPPDAPSVETDENTIVLPPRAWQRVLQSSQARELVEPLARLFIQADPEKYNKSFDYAGYNTSSRGGRQLTLGIPSSGMGSTGYANAEAFLQRIYPDVLCNNDIDDGGFVPPSSMNGLVKAAKQWYPQLFNHIPDYDFPRPPEVLPDNPNVFVIRHDTNSPPIGYLSKVPHIGKEGTSQWELRIPLDGSPYENSRLFMTILIEVSSQHAEASGAWFIAHLGTPTPIKGKFLQGRAATEKNMMKRILTLCEAIEDGAISMADSTGPEILQKLNPEHRTPGHALRN